MDSRDRLSNDQIAAVVVLYHPPQSILSNVQTYLAGVGALYLWDNSPGECAEVVAELKSLPRVEYMTEGRNVGIVRAMNMAARKALAGGRKYLLTMDQDSAASENMIGVMLSSAGDDPTIGVIAPYHLDRNAPLPPPAEDIEYVDAAMTSGNLVNLAAHAKVGGFQELLFIDYVDTEYCLRLQVEGFRVVRVNRAVLSHAEGHYTPRRFFGLTVYPTNHSPARFYYRARNRLYVRRMFRRRFPVFVRFLDKMYWRTIAKMLLYERHRPAKVLMICRGLIAYWRGDFSSGPLQ